jgi:hypothetical protein
MQEVRNPFPIFLGMDGLALELGYIYIGIENEDPETSPKDIYSDSAGLTPIEQPVRTLAGYPDSSGTPAQIFTAGKFSIRARNAQGEQVFYLASAGESETTSAGDPYHVHGQYLGDAPGVQETVSIHVFGVAASFEADLPGAIYFHCDTVPTGNCAFVVTKNGTPYGTITVDTTGDVTADCDAADFDIGDYFEMISPDTSTDIANFGFTMIGAAA